MKKIAKKIVAAILGWQVRRLYKKNTFKVVAVTGSIGKTSTKLAIATVLSEKFKVCYQEGNYNDLVSVPLVFFGQIVPSLYNPIAWLGVFWRQEKILKQPFNYEVVVLELGSDGPGQLDEFMAYLKVDYGVLTAITPEHMLNFTDIDAVAKEELVIAELSNLTFVNNDLCPRQYIDNKLHTKSYAMVDDGDIRAPKIEITPDNNHSRVAVFDKNQPFLVFDTNYVISKAEVYSRLAAVSIANELEMDKNQIQAGLAKIKAFSGRMNRLKGINNSLIIDDSYNASPAAVVSALDELYSLKSPQKIAVLGNMNELGKYSEDEHRKIGEYCDPKQLNLVLTIGPDANKFLAPAAEAKGCKVVAFDSPYAAGDYLRSQIQENATVLIKGSQNKVFAEETVKAILQDPKDSTKLVRQSPEWMKIKAKAFKV